MISEVEIQMNHAMRISNSFEYTYLNIARNPCIYQLLLLKYVVRYRLQYR